MGRVVAGVAHEIRNPLFGISSVGQILERELTDPEHLELVRALLSETKRMNELVEELLQYGKPMKLNLVRCDVIALFKEVLGMYRNEFQQRDLRLSEDLPAGQLPAFLDVNQVRQMFLNLLRNSMDATPPGGEIRIRTLLEDRYIVFQIIDTGIGIPAKNKDRIFDLFFTTKPKGTGLGLGICRKIVQDHGGEIVVASRESDETRGTTVTVKLPYRGAAEKPETGA
jgi:signal transduction histidine kinase